MYISSYSPRVSGARMVGWEKRNHPDTSECATPLVEGNLPLIPLSEGCPKGGVEKELTPQI